MEPCIDPLWAERQWAADAMGRRRWPDAIRFWTTIIDHEPSNATAYANRGACHIMSNRRDLAIEDFTQAISFDPNLGWAFRARGACYGEDNFTQSLADLAEAIRLDPRDWIAYRTRAQVLFYSRRYDEALSDLDYLLSQPEKVISSFKPNFLAGVCVLKADCKMALSGHDPGIADKRYHRTVRAPTRKRGGRRNRA